MFWTPASAGVTIGGTFHEIINYEDLKEPLGTKSVIEFSRQSKGGTILKDFAPPKNI
jgi:hypothetical protein